LIGQLTQHSTWHAIIHDRFHCTVQTAAIFLDHYGLDRFTDYECRQNLPMPTNSIFCICNRVLCARVRNGTLCSGVFLVKSRIALFSRKPFPSRRCMGASHIPKAFIKPPSHTEILRRSGAPPMSRMNLGRHMSAGGGSIYGTSRRGNKSEPVGQDYGVLESKRWPAGRVSMSAVEGSIYFKTRKFKSAS